VSKAKEENKKLIVSSAIEIQFADDKKQVDI
jgi:hypothetical protein